MGDMETTTTRESKTMKASEITLGNGDILIDNVDDSSNRWPRTCRDGQAFHRDRWIKENGDMVVELTFKGNGFNVYSVPSFKAQRDSFSNAKAKDCSRWGSE